MLAWSQGEVDIGESEKWSEFEARVSTAIEEINQTSKKHDTILLVSSGGAIAMALKQILGLSVEKMIDLNFQIKNTSVTNVEIKKDRLVLSGFNHTPHLDAPERRSKISFA